eukprot:TRINITY_DN3669_c0_g1_i1.p1 TRINITY_DN3669_c0_g1~~TRINITY_DN3669_c0_g1_i1.p1  ORF type:complete len:154 (-),score=41.42 TRINITY_DN3669_c0_g1_i1:45-506(-)
METDAAPVVDGNHPQRDDLLRFLMDMFKKYGVCNVAFLNQHLQALKEPGEHQYETLRVGVENQYFMSTLKSLAGSIKDTNIYFLKSLGDQDVDKFRAVIINQFQDRLSQRKTELQAACKHHLGDNIPAHTFNKILTELAYIKGKCWFFKEGNG